MSYSMCVRTVCVSLGQGNGVNMSIYCNIEGCAFCIVSSVSEDTFYTVHVGVCTCVRMPCLVEGLLC